MLKNGLYVTKGTAGGRKSPPAAAAGQELTAKTAEASSAIGVRKILVIEEILALDVGLVQNWCGWEDAWYYPSTKVGQAFQPDGTGMSGSGTMYPWSA
jgi:hypothetical protein